MYQPLTVLRWGAQPCGAPVRTSHAAHGPLSQTPLGCRQGAAPHAADMGYKREPLRPDVAGREDTTAMTRMRNVEGYI